MIAIVKNTMRQSQSKEYKLDWNYNEEEAKKIEFYMKHGIHPDKLACNNKAKYLRKNK